MESGNKGGGWGTGCGLWGSEQGRDEEAGPQTGLAMPLRSSWLLVAGGAQQLGASVAAKTITSTPHSPGLPPGPCQREPTGQPEGSPHGHLHPRPTS